MLESGLRVPRFLRVSMQQKSAIDGRAVAGALRAGLIRRIQTLAQRGVRPGLAVLQIGNDPASRIYVRNKVKACAEVGIESIHTELPPEIPEAELLGRIRALNDHPGVHGILVQLPLPSGLDADRIVRAIAVEKDVDGFHPDNVGLLARGTPRFVPCTPLGVMKLLEHEHIAVEGRHAVIVGRSNVVGKPVALLLLQQGATVTICHSKTSDLGSMTRQADILVVAAGKPRLVVADMVRAGATVIDVGINRLPNGTLCGDADFEGVSAVASRITPVPGGVGPMTIAMLLENAVLAAERASQTM
jgi:methylenetetrahydrofolate dehydrogenase (NADP+)/methenyltetrahydrofolate cyclohydrolase